MHGQRPTLASLHGMVAAAHPLAAQAGARLLAEGGNAFDAAAATAAALNVVEPFMSGLAGLGLATMWVAAEQRVRVLDYVPNVPAAFPVERFRDREELARGALSVGVPGNLAGWCELVRAYGRKSLSEVFAPAIRLAETGFPVVEFGAAEITEITPVLKAYPSFYDDWAKNYLPAGGAMKVGDVLRQPDLAATLRAIAEKGPALLHRGELGQRIVAHLAKLGGALTMDDLARAAPVWREPMSASYRGMSINTAPPPCEGFQFLLALRILDGVDLRRLERNGVEHLDYVCRAIRLAAGVRIAHNNPSPAKLAELMSDASVEALRRRLRDGAPVEGPTEQWTPSPVVDPGHTTSLSVADSDGNLVCITQSLGALFGSGIVVPGTGVCMNNFLYWADVQPGSPNRTRPRDALPICMAPSISTRDGAPVLALGTPGSYGILQTQVQALVQYLDFDLPIQDAIEAPRARLWDGRVIEIENRVSGATVAALRDRGHDIKALDVGWTMRVGGMQAIALDRSTGAMTGAADPRRDGYVATP